MEISGLSFDLSVLHERKPPEPETLYDILILGGGPAAMAAAIYAARKMMKLALITKDFGGQVSSTSEIGNYLGFQTITGSDLVEKFKEQVMQFDIPIAVDEKVVEVKKERNYFSIRVERGVTYRSRTVIVATGKRNRTLNVPGEKELTGKGVAWCSICDAPFFKNKKVVIAGGGNSAVSAALDLLKVAEAVTIVNFEKGWQADEILIESVKKNKKLIMLDYHQIMAIQGSEKVIGVKVKNRTTEEESDIPADGVFIEIGLLPNSEFVRDLVQLNDFNEMIVDCACRTNVEGLFGAGDVTTVPYKQIVISAGEGSKAALAAYDYLTHQESI